MSLNSKNMTFSGQICAFLDITIFIMIDWTKKSISLKNLAKFKCECRIYFENSNGNWSWVRDSREQFCAPVAALAAMVKRAMTMG